MINIEDKAKQKRSEEKLEVLKKTLRSYGSVLIAYSGGVDSAFLMKVATDELGSKAVALTAVSPSLPESELFGAIELAKSIDATHVIVKSNEVSNPKYQQNPENRCYYCKSELYSICQRQAEKLGLNQVIDGFNADDKQDYRPGRVAAAEKDVASPLSLVGLTKIEIRYLSKTLSLPTWDKPNMACLSSRFPYGTEITPERLKTVELAEEYLKELGFGQLRVRYYGDKAKIELDKSETFKFTSSIEEKVKIRFNELGFSKVTLDEKGYRSGSLNENINQNKTTHKKEELFGNIELRTN